MSLSKVSVVIPVFNEEAVLPELFQRMKDIFAQQGDVAWEVILVNDGSRDSSAALVHQESGRDPRFVLLELSRNFGFQAALAAGLDEAASRGCDAVVTMDADLQDPPEVIPELITEWRKGAEVVLAIRRSRQETGLRRVAFDAFHKVFQRVSDFPIEANTGTFGLVDRAALEALNNLPERNRFFPGLRSWVGFRVAEVMYDRKLRAAGEPQQSFSRLLRYALDGVFSFSYLPLRVLTYAGIVVCLIGFSLGLFFVARRILGIESAQTGFTTLVTLLLFLGGVQLVGIGILGEYLGRIYDEVKQRPHYLMRPPRPRK